MWVVLGLSLVFSHVNGVMKFLGCSRWAPLPLAFRLQLVGNDLRWAADDHQRWGWPLVKSEIQIRRRLPDAKSLASYMLAETQPKVW